MTLYEIGERFEKIFVEFVRCQQFECNSLLDTLANLSAPPDLWLIGSIAMTVMVGATLGAVYFFFECRWPNMKADASTKA